jgi:hypothetical protein
MLRHGMAGLSPVSALILAFLLMGLAGCAKPVRVNPAYYAAEEDAGGAYQEPEGRPMAAETSALRSPFPASPPRSGKPAKRSKSDFASLASDGDAPLSIYDPRYYAQAPQEPRPSAKRMVHYSGSATLRSTEPERILDSAIAVVKAEGGYLEQRSQGFVALRVPSERFDTLFLRILRLSQVIDYNQQAEDITEAVNDTELRLKVVVSTLERLEDLVKKARTEAQKLRLLGELKKFREEREVLESRKRDLVERARFASIRLTVLAYAPIGSTESWRRDLRDFLWIHKLNPFDDRRFRGLDNLKFKAPEGMVVSRKWWHWRATSSQGSEFWGSERDVKPIGDSRFWREAIRHRLKDGFKTADTLAAGAFQFTRFKSFGPTPYYYWVGVRSRGDEIHLAEFYFPNEEQQAKLLPGALAAVERKSK